MAMENLYFKNSGKIDLHLHTTNSDGEETPEELIRHAKESGMDVISITDHNRFTYTECFSYEGMLVIPGIELSCEYVVPNRNESIEVHVVGIFPYDVKASNFSEVLSKLRDSKIAYVEAILADLEKRAIHITMKEIEDIDRNYKQIGRHEIAKVLVNKGIEPDIDAAFDHQIGNFSPHYIPSTKYIHFASMECIVRLIMDNCGIPILAHPYGYGFDESEIEQLILDFRNIATTKKTGEFLAAAVEVYYQLYLTDQCKIDFLKRIQKEYGLLASAASDKHKISQPFCTAGSLSLFQDMLNAMESIDKVMIAK